MNKHISPYHVRYFCLKIASGFQYARSISYRSLFAVTVFLVLTGFMPGITPARAASFDCEKASALVEKHICASPELSRLDEQLAVLYQQSLDAPKNKVVIQRQQHEWLTEKRDTCRDEQCVKAIYTARIKELSTALFRQKGIGFYRCGVTRSLTDNSSMGLNFSIRDGIITEFNAVTTISDSDLARGYTNTCVQHIGNFYQTAGRGEYALQFSQPENQYGESPDCKFYIKDIRSKFQVYSSNCRSECMKFNFEVNKTGKDCYHEP